MKIIVEALEGLMYFLICEAITAGLSLIFTSFWPQIIVTGCLIVGGWYVKYKWWGILILISGNALSILFLYCSMRITDVMWIAVLPLLILNGYGAGIGSKRFGGVFLSGGGGKGGKTITIHISES